MASTYTYKQPMHRLFTISALSPFSALEPPLVPQLQRLTNPDQLTDIGYWKSDS